MIAAGKEYDGHNARQMTHDGGRLLVECLVALRATKCFGVPGESYLALLDAVHDRRGRFDFVLCRNEAAP